MKKGNKIISGISVLLFLIGNASAVTWLDYQDGSAGREFSGWTHSAFGGALYDPGTTSVTGNGSLTAAGNTIGELFDVYGALFYTEAFGGVDPVNMTDYLGTGTEVAGMSMDLSSGTPSGLGFYFQGAGSHWFYQIPVLTVDPGRYSVSFASETGWSGHGNVNWTGASATWADSLADVTRVGFFIYFNPNANQTYEFGDFGLTVPEPETYMILGMALLSVAVVFRRRISDSLAEARAVLQA
jgi:hypothetical protein